MFIGYKDISLSLFASLSFIIPVCCINQHSSVRWWNVTYYSKWAHSVEVSEAGHHLNRSLIDDVASFSFHLIVLRILIKLLEILQNKLALSFYFSILPLTEPDTQFNFLIHSVQVKARIETYFIGLLAYIFFLWNWKCFSNRRFHKLLLILCFKMSIICMLMETCLLSPLTELWWDHCAASWLPELHPVSSHSQLQRSWKYHIRNQGQLCGTWHTLARFQLYDICFSVSALHVQCTAH